MERRDVCVVGGGPAGLGAALALAARGLRPLVIERGRGDLDKACGEGVLPAGVARLRELGVELPPESPLLEGVRYIEGRLSVEASFGWGEGRGVRRLALSRALRERALACGVELWQGVEAGRLTQTSGSARLETSRGVVEADWLVAADGLRSGLRQQAGIPVRHGRPRFGVRRHYRCRPWSRHVEVHWGEALEAYVTPVGPDCVGVALLGEDCSGGPDALLGRFPELRARLGPAASAPRGAGPFALRPGRRSRGRVLLVGDAAGYLDPLTGEGLALALASAEALAAALAEGRPARYERAWRNLTRRHLTLTALVLALARRPALRRRVLGGLARRPQAFGALLAYASEAPSAPGGVAALGRLAAALLAGPRPELSPGS